MPPRSISTAPRSRHAKVWGPLVLACLVLTACGDKGKPEAKVSQAAARVDGTELTVHQINQMLERQGGLKPEQLESASRQALEGLIDQQLVLAKAEESKLDRDPQIVQLLDATRRNILARAYLERASATAASAPTAQAVQQYYDANPALFAQRKVYMLEEFTVPAKPEVAQPLIEKLKATRGLAEFGKVLKASGLVFNAAQATQPAEALPLPLVDKLAQVGMGEALYVNAPDGFKAVLVLAAQPQPMAFEQAKPVIEQFLVAEAHRNFSQNEIKRLRAAAKIEYIGNFAKPASAPASSTSNPTALPEAVTPSPVATMPAASEPSSPAPTLDTQSLNKGLSGLK